MVAYILQDDDTDQINKGKKTDTKVMRFKYEQ